MRRLRGNENFKIYLGYLNKLFIEAVDSCVESNDGVTVEASRLEARTLKKVLEQTEKFSTPEK